METKMTALAAHTEETVRQLKQEVLGMVGLPIIHNLNIEIVYLLFLFD